MALRKDITDIRQTHSEAEPIEKVLEAMVSAGIIEPGERDCLFQHVTPVELDGPPLSEQIIADRR